MRVGTGVYECGGWGLFPVRWGVASFPTNDTNLKENPFTQEFIKGITPIFPHGL